jgi:hypothetical protein
MNPNTDDYHAEGPDPNDVQAMILAQHRARMKRTERLHRRHLRWMWAATLVLRPATAWLLDRIIDHFG